MVFIGTRAILGLKATQSSPFTIIEFWIVTLSLRYIFQPSVFLAALEEVDPELILILLKTTPCASLT